MAILAPPVEGHSVLGRVLSGRESLGGGFLGMGSNVSIADGSTNPPP